MTVCDHVAEAVSLGATVCSLGIHSMPSGYTLLRDEDGYYTWMEDATGRESVICWDRWAVRQWASSDAGGLKTYGASHDRT